MAGLPQGRHVPSSGQIAKAAGGKQRQQPSAFRRWFSPHDDARAPLNPLALFPFKGSLIYG
jgi:hypothetical protein